MTDEIVTADEACRLLGAVSKMFIWRRLRDDESFPRPIRYSPHGPRYWLREEIIAWREEHRVQS